MKVRYHPDARMELLGTTEWYEERREMLGADFLAEVRNDGGPPWCMAAVAERES